jgi:hypothetical protein
MMGIDAASRGRVAEELGKLLAAEGVAISTMPRMFCILMRRACPADEAAVNALDKVLSAGIVAAMREEKGEPEQVPALADRLVQSTSMPEDDARWAIETWWRAVRPMSEGSAKDWSAWNRLDVPESAGLGGVYRRAMIHMLIVGVAGALGGALWGVYFLTRRDRPPIAPVAEAVEGLADWLQPIALFAFGAIGGFGGGVVGWIVGGGRSWTYDAFGGTTLGRLGYSSSVAFSGAGAGGITGLAAMGLPGMMLGALIGGAAGAYLGLLIAEQRTYWHR